MEEDLRSARERFHVGGVLGENLNDVFCDAVFATDVREWSAHGV